MRRKTTEFGQLLPFLAIARHGGNPGWSTPFVHAARLFAPTPSINDLPIHTPLRLSRHSQPDMSISHLNWTQFPPDPTRFEHKDCIMLLFPSGYFIDMRVAAQPETGIKVINHCSAGLIVDMAGRETFLHQVDSDALDSPTAPLRIRHSSMTTTAENGETHRVGRRLKPGGIQLSDCVESWFSTDVDSAEIVVLLESLEPGNNKTFLGRVDGVQQSISVQDGQFSAIRSVNDTARGKQWRTAYAVGANVRDRCPLIARRRCREWQVGEEVYYAARRWTVRDCVINEE